jgi:hypothetical protein
MDEHTGRELGKPRARKWRRYQPIKGINSKILEYTWMRKISKTESKRYYCGTTRLLWPKSHCSVPLHPLSH